MEISKNKSIRIYIKSGVLVACATTILYLVLSLVTWLQKEVAQQGFKANVVQLNDWVLHNPISIAWLCVCFVLFKIFVEPYALAALAERDSFISRLGVLVVGSLVVAGFISLVAITFNRYLA